MSLLLRQAYRGLPTEEKVDGLKCFHTLFPVSALKILKSPSWSFFPWQIRMKLPNEIFLKIEPQVLCTLRQEPLLRSSEFATCPDIELIPTSAHQEHSAHRV